jgi:uncharacterized protein YwgA
MTMADNVRDIISANGGRLVGRTRLQKSDYILEAAGVGYGFEFNYHYYGPYSEELAVAAADAQALGLIDVTWEVSQSGSSYAIYLAQDVPHQMNPRRREILQVLSGYGAITLELAATAHFLAQNGYREDPWNETRRRKSVKATPDRMTNAKRLLDQVGLSLQ